MDVIGLWARGFEFWVGFGFVVDLGAGGLVAGACRRFSRFSVLLGWMWIWLAWCGLVGGLVGFLWCLLAYCCLDWCLLLIWWVGCGGLVVGRFVVVVVFGCALITCFV